MFKKIKEVENNFVKTILNKVYDYNIELIETNKLYNKSKIYTQAKKKYINKIDNKIRNNEATQKEIIEYNKSIELTELINLLDTENKLQNKVSALQSTIKTLMLSINEYTKDNGLIGHDFKIIYDMSDYLENEEIKNGINYVRTI